MTIAQEINFGYSPSSSADFEDGLNPLAFDDEFQHDPLGLEGEDDDEEVKFEQQQNAQQSSTKPKRSNNRKGPGNADKRATHNAVERARRESLNGRFSVLADSLPTMKNIKRPSKAMIVNKALDFVYNAQLRERTLVQENNELRREVDQLRARLGMPPLPPPAPLPESESATQPTMRKNRKLQSVKASTASSSLKNAQTESNAHESTTPSTDGAYPSPTISAYSSTGSAQPPVYDTADFTPSSSIFPSLSNDQPHGLTRHDSAPSPTDTLASATSPTFLPPTFDASPILQHSASAPATSAAFGNLYNPAMLQAQLSGMLPPQAIFQQQASSYFNNPALLYAMQQQYLAHQQQQQQQQQQQTQAQHHHSPATSTSSPGSFTSFSQPNDSTSLWAAGTPPSWGPFSHQTPSTVDGLSF
ncbi:uncharacterized protein JCM6883_003379 [Sporobolomyces salmoneus]|uniref:uncharacterized protein n=1 Tax=Sporobolomyces salmoneus TaxID=183962 RepID=UPI00317A7468